METYNFDVAHGYNKIFGIIRAKTKEDSISRIQNGDWNETIDIYEDELDDPVKGYKLVDIWED